MTTTNSQSAERWEQAVSREAWEGTGTQTRQGRAETGGMTLCAKLVWEAVALAGFSMPDTGEQQQRDVHPSITRANPKVRERALGSWGQGRKQEVTWPEQRQAVASER